MVISGMYIETLNGKALEVAKRLIKLEGIEVHYIEEETNKIVITLEAETLDKSYRVADQFKAIEGVLSTCLVYSNFEDELYATKAVGKL
jgi:periplasmic nitrate reductase NapD